MSTNITLLLAEDNENLGKLLEAFLVAKGFTVVHASNGEAAYELFCAQHIDLCLVDVMMPIKDGFTLAKEIRKKDSRVPIIFITAKIMQEDMIHGLSIGGDDYILKPFSMEVLLAKINAILRRINLDTKPIEQPQQIQLGTIVFDVNRRTLTAANGKVKKLTTRETELLMMLIEKKCDVLERGYALKKIWGDDSYYNARIMDVYITKLRKLFVSDPSVQIINVHGIGFKLVM